LFLIDIQEAPSTIELNDTHDMNNKVFLFTFIACAPTAMAISILDGDFSAWDFSSTGVGTGYVIRDAGDGNPAPRVYIYSDAPSNEFMMATAIKADLSSNIPLAGEGFSLSLDVYSGSLAFGEGQAIWLLLRQNGTIYANYLGITGYPHFWDTVTFTDSFAESNFFRLTDTGPLSPDLSGGTSTQFGFGAGNFVSRTDHYYDSFRLDIVPEPGVVGLLVGASLVLTTVRPKRFAGRNSAPAPATNPTI
jgi:hypothetical protein